MTPSFLQSAEWERVQRAEGRHTARVEGLLLIRHDLPFGFSYYYLPRPGAFDFTTLLEVAEYARNAGAIFLRIDPALPLPTLRAPMPVGHAGGMHHPLVRQAPPLQAQTTSLVRCDVPEEARFAAMHQKTRYNIRLAERHGVSVQRVSEGALSSAFSIFIELLAETARRDGFVPHPKEHYRSLLGVSSEDFSNELWFAEHNGTPIAGAIVNWYRPSKTATYLHGGSSYAARAKMGPHLLHAKIMAEAESRGFPGYDLGGIHLAKWPGLTRFKEGFGGTRVVFPESQDVVLKPLLYSLYRLRRVALRRST